MTGDTFWNEGEPNDHGAREECGEISRNVPHNSSWEWNDVSCGEKRSYVCELRHHIDFPLAIP